MFKKSKNEKVKRQNSIDLPINVAEYNNTHNQNVNEKNSTVETTADPDETANKSSKFVDNFKRPFEFLKRSSPNSAFGKPKRSRSLANFSRKRGSEIAPSENSAVVVDKQKSITNFNAEGKAEAEIIEFDKATLIGWAEDVEPVRKLANYANADDPAQSVVIQEERSFSVNTHYAMDNVVDWNPLTDDIIQAFSTSPEADKNDLLSTIAEPPADVVNHLLNVDSYHDRQDLLSAPIYRLDKNINLHILTKFVSPRQTLHEEQVFWNLDYLITTLSKDLLHNDKKIL